MSLKNCKTAAKNRLKTRRLRAFRISLYMASAAVLFGFAAYYLPQALSGITQNPYLLTAAQTALLLFKVSLLGSLRQGRAAWMYCCACGREPSGLQFAYWLRRGRGMRSALLFLNVRMRKTVWMLLLAAPGAAVLAAGVRFDAHLNGMMRLFLWAGGTVSIVTGIVIAVIICRKYALAPILLARSPHKGVRSAVRGSCSLMEDDCMRLFLLELSFLPWFAACLAVVPLVYVVPYYQQSRAVLLRDILCAHTI
jgi:hypothetical protein